MGLLGLLKQKAGEKYEEYRKEQAERADFEREIRAKEKEIRREEETKFRGEKIREEYKQRLKSVRTGYKQKTPGFSGLRLNPNAMMSVGTNKPFAFNPQALNDFTTYHPPGQPQRRQNLPPKSRGDNRPIIIKVYGGSRGKKTRKKQRRFDPFSL